MKLSDFDYDLPKELIARYPADQRTGSRLLSLDGPTGCMEHKQFTDILDLINPGDLLIFNNSKVMQARLYGQKPSGGKVEILVERVLDEHHVLAHVKSSKALKDGAKFTLESKIEVEVLGRQDSLFHLKFLNQEPLLELLDNYGHMPLPPYMEREATDMDKERYQTVYADPQGSVAAPTAGLHFDDGILEKLKAKGASLAFLTLHVGAGTFQPVRVEDIAEHHMHGEVIDVPEFVCEKIKKTKAAGGRIIAVGTTTTRSLETAALSGEIKPFCGETDIFIYPGFDFKCIDAMVTNFHLPESSLLMLMSAFAGYENIMKAYFVAVQEQYRFYSYGDAMFVTKREV